MTVDELHAARIGPFKAFKLYAREVVIDPKGTLRIRHGFPQNPARLPRLTQTTKSQDQRRNRQGSTTKHGPVQ